MDNHTKEIFQIRRKILSNPNIILDDIDLMKTLISQSDALSAGNIVDIRSLAMKRLETRVKKVESTNRTIVAAAYENISGTNIIHEALLKLMEINNFHDLENQLLIDLPIILKISNLHLMLENDLPELRPTKLRNCLSLVKPGTVDKYIRAGSQTNIKKITLRRIPSGSRLVYPNLTNKIKSEALIKLDLGSSRFPALLLMGSTNSDQFHSKQGTELLNFFGKAIERILRHWQI